MKKYLLITIILLIVLSLTACSDAKTPDDDNSSQEEENDILEEDADKADEDEIEREEPDQEEDQVKEPSPETKEEKVTLYFANLEYIETGNEKLEHFISQERTLNYDNISMEEAIVKELMKSPDDDSMTTEIPNTIKLIDVKASDGTAFVNFAKEGLSGGSLQEYFVINQIVKSLLELDSVDKVQFLIDGEKAETLMGHYEISDPFEE